MPNHAEIFAFTFTPPTKEWYDDVFRCLMKILPERCRPRASQEIEDDLPSANAVRIHRVCNPTTQWASLGRPWMSVSDGLGL